MKLWNDPVINGTTDVIVSPETIDSVLNRISALTIKNEVLVDDLQEYAFIFPIRRIRIIFVFYIAKRAVTRSMYVSS